MSIMKKKSVAVLMLVLGAGVCLLPMQTASAQPALPAVLKDMPSGAMAVVACRSLDALSAKVDVFAHQLNILPQEQSLNIAQILGAKFGLADQLDGAAGIGLCIMNLASVEETAVAFLPVRNTGSAIQALGAQALADSPNIYKSDMGVFIKSMGRYLIFGGNPEILKSLDNMPKGIKLNAAAEKIFSKTDLAGTVTLATLMPMAKAAIMGHVANEPNLQEYPALKSIITMAVDRIAELHGATLGASLGQQGLSLNMNLQAVDASVLASYLANHPTTDISGLSALPGGKYMTASVYRLDNRVIADPLNCIMDTLAQDTAMQEKMDTASLSKLKTVLNRLFSLSQVGAEGSYLPQSGPPMTGSTPNIMIVNTYSGNTDQICRNIAEACPLVTNILTKTGLTLPVTYQSNAGKTGSYSYDQLTIDLSKLPLPPEAMMTLGSLFSEGGMKFYLCKTGTNKMVTAMNPSALQEGINLIKNQPGLNQDAQIKEVAQNLAPQANAYSFINFSNYIQFVMANMQAQMQAMSKAQGNQAQPNPMMGMMGMFGMMFSQVQGTVGVSATLADGGANMEIFVPKSLIQSVVNIGMMMQGGGPGGPSSSGSSTF